LTQHSSKSPVSPETSLQAAHLRKKRTEILKDRYKYIPPNEPFFSKIGFEDEDYIPYIADDVERESDGDYEAKFDYDWDEESIDDSTDSVYDLPPSKRPMMAVEPSESTHTTRFNKSKCVIKQLLQATYQYSATFFWHQRCLSLPSNSVWCSLPLHF
jgi:hypothetical protein